MKIKSLKSEADLLKYYFFHYFPGFSVSFFTYKDYLIPVNQGLLEAEGSHKAWDIILSPGRVWSEPGDNGMSRAINSRIKRFRTLVVLTDRFKRHQDL